MAGTCEQMNLPRAVACAAPGLLFLDAQSLALTEQLLDILDPLYPFLVFAHHTQ